MTLAQRLCKFSPWMWAARPLGLGGLLLSCVAGTPAHGGRPVYHEVPAQEVAARAQVIVQGVLVEEGAGPDCDFAWRVRVVRVLRLAKNMAPALRPVPGKAITITNRGLSGRFDCEVRRANPGSKGVSFSAAQMAGGEEGWRAFLQKKPVFLLLVAEEAGQLRFVMDLSVALDGDQLQPGK